MKHVKLLIGLVIAALITVGFILVTTTHTITVSIVSTAWTREDKIENLIPRTFTNWQESVPSDAVVLRSYQAVRSTSSICVAYDSKFNCTFHTIINHYSTKVDYTAVRWGYERSQVVSGQDDDPIPFWPTPDYQTCTAQNCERDGGTTERYTVTYQRDDKSTFVCDVNGMMYGEFMPNQKDTLQDGTFIHIPRCDTIERLSH